VMGPVRRGSTVYLLHYEKSGKYITYAVMD